MKYTNLLIGCALALMISSAVAKQELVIVSGRSDNFIRPVVEEFSKQTGIKVILHAGKSTELLNKLRLEGKRSAADIFISNDAGNLEKGSEWQLFSPIPEAVLQPIDANFRATDSTWVGLSARARVLVVNTKAQDLAFVDSVFDLSDPRLKGRIGITNSANESFIAGVTVYLQMSGKEKLVRWLQGLKENVGNEVYSKHSHIVSDVAIGKKEVGLVNHYYIYRHLEKNPQAPIKIVLPDNQEEEMGLAWNVAGAAITRHAPHREEALALVKFLVSEAGQKIFAEVNHEYPTRAKVDAAKVVIPKAQFKVANVPMSLLGARREETLDLIEKIGLP